MTTARTTGRAIRMAIPIASNNFHPLIHLIKLRAMAMAIRQVISSVKASWLKATLKATRMVTMMAITLAHRNTRKAFMLKKHHLPIIKAMGKAIKLASNKATMIAKHRTVAAVAVVLVAVLLATLLTCKGNDA
jgi:hypothetical protein